MARKTLRQVMAEDHRKQTKNFSRFMSVLYGTVTILLSMLLASFLLIAFLNPLWFREKLFNFIQYKGPVFCRKLQNLLFKSYINKVNLFETLKVN